MTKYLVTSALAAVLCLAAVQAEDKMEGKTETVHVETTHIEHHEGHQGKKKHSTKKHHAKKRAKKHHEVEGPRECKKHHHGHMIDMNGTMKVERCYLPGMIRENMADGVLGQETTPVTHSEGDSSAWIWMPKGSCGKITVGSVVTD